MKVKLQKRAVSITEVSFRPSKTCPGTTPGCIWSLLWQKPDNPKHTADDFSWSNHRSSAVIVTKSPLNLGSGTKNAETWREVAPIEAVTCQYIKEMLSGNCCCALSAIHTDQRETLESNLCAFTHGKLQSPNQLTDNCEEQHATPLGLTHSHSALFFTVPKMIQGRSGAVAQHHEADAHKYTTKALQAQAWMPLCVWVCDDKKRLRWCFSSSHWH